MKNKVDLCVPCYIKLKESYDLTLIAGGVSNKVTCSQCGKRRYGSTYEMKARRSDHA